MDTEAERPVRVLNVSQGVTGIESVQTSVPTLAKRHDNTPSEATQDDSKRREVSVSATLETASTDMVEAALAEALALAATAGRFDVVAQRARELEARRFARAGNVLTLDARQKGRR